MFKYAPTKRVILSDFSGYIAQAVARSLHQYRLNFSGFPEIALKRGSGQIEVSLNLEGTGMRALVVTEKNALVLAKRFRDRRPVDVETQIKVRNAIKSLVFGVRPCGTKKGYELRDTPG